MSGSKSEKRKPKLIAFDLDGTVWSPDMYQLWGGGSPFTVVDAQHELSDRVGNRVRLLGSIGHILHSLNFDDEWKDTKIAWVSCTDEPEWANECLRKFMSNPSPTSACKTPTALSQLCHASEIYKSNKQFHIRNLQVKFPDIALEDYLFFDNEKHNVEAVARLGVMSIHCPHGVDSHLWDSALDKFAAAAVAATVAAAAAARTAAAAGAGAAVAAAAAGAAAVAAAAAANSKAARRFSED
jgi:magnesium-dependent phosphatase 1